MASSTGKNVVGEVSGWLRIYNDGTVDRAWSGPPQLQLFLNSVPPHHEFIDGVATTDVVIDPNTGLAARIYIPETQDPSLPHKDDPNPKLPLVLHFPGGGFCFSQADWYLYCNFYARLVPAARAVFVSVYLPLAPEHKLPAACDAAFVALSWLGLVATGARHEPWLQDRADFQRVFLAGDSTGGNIVHSVATRAGSLDALPVRLVGGLALHPGFLRAKPSRSFLESKETPFLTRDMIDKFMDLAVPVASETTKDHPVISPMGPQAPPLAGLKLPPMLVAVAEDDLLLDTELEYCEALKAAGKEVEVVFSSGVGHCFYLSKMAMESDPKTASEGVKLIEAIVNFISRH